MWLIIFQRLSIDFLIHLVYFPLWWYTGGLKRAAMFCVDFIKSGNLRLAPGLWLRNIMVPMFGQTDLQGRLISIFMRLVNVIFRSIALFFWLWVAVFIFFIWIALPVFVTYMLVLAF